jgi:hypothetical protein
MKKFILLALISCCILVVPLTASATEKTGWGASVQNLGNVTNSTGLSGDLGATLGTVVQAALALVGTIFLILTIYAGILWMIATGKDEQIEKAKKIITASIIGLFITLSAYAITFFITTKLGGQ